MIETIYFTINRMALPTISAKIANRETICNITVGTDVMFIKTNVTVCDEIDELRLTALN